MTERAEQPAGSSSLTPDDVAELYAAHAKEIRWFLLGICGRAGHVDDYLQQVFVIAAQRGGECRCDARRAWLFQVASNLVKADRRREAGRMRILTRIAGERDDVVEEASAAVMRDEERHRLLEAITTLSQNEQQIVQLRIREGLTFQQIADRLDIPLGTALTRMRTALLKLQRYLSAGDASP